MIEAPVIETERLVLRPWRKDDFRPYHAIVSHPEVHKHFGPEPMSAEDCWRRLMASVGGWMLNGFGTWAVELKADGKLIGNVGFFTAWRDLQPEFGDEPEMGWMFAAETHGRGIAYEASGTALEWLDDSGKGLPVWAIVAPANEPSLRLAGKLGFEVVGETSYHDEATIVLRRPAPEGFRRRSGP